MTENADRPKCPYHSVTTSTNARRNGGKIIVDRRQGVPFVVIEAESHTDSDGKPRDPEDILLDALRTGGGIDLTPEEAIALGQTLIALGEDCKKYPDRRTLRAQGSRQGLTGE